MKYVEKILPEKPLAQPAKIVALKTKALFALLIFAAILFAVLFESNISSEKRKKLHKIKIENDLYFRHPKY